jgi:chromosome segregation ATPase
LYETKHQNAELVQVIEELNGQIVKKTSEYENLIEEIEEMSRTIENYERDVKLRLDSERTEWQLKYKKMETERMRLVLEVEERHQVIRNNEKEREQLQARIQEVEEQYRK